MLNTPMGALVVVMLFVVANALVYFAFYLPRTPAPIPPTTRPNILFVMTDDMPENLLNRMPEVDTRIVSESINFPNVYVSQSLCCPSRASILTGMYPHNTGVWSNDGPHGGGRYFPRAGPRTAQCADLAYRERL